MKSTKRVFNFNLPDDLRDYLRFKSERDKTTISQCIINLIIKDKENNDDEVFNKIKSRVIEKLTIKKGAILITENEINDICKDEIKKYKLLMVDK